MTSAKYLFICFGYNLCYMFIHIRRMLAIVYNIYQLYIYITAHAHYFY